MIEHGPVLTRAAAEPLFRPAWRRVLGRPASPQFSDERPTLVRFIRFHDWVPGYDDWAWIDCYGLSDDGVTAVERRSLFVRLAGVRAIQPGDVEALLRFPDGR